MSMAKFEAIVEAAKEQELEIERLKALLKEIESVSIVKKTDIATLQKRPTGQTWKLDRPVEDHSSVTHGFKYITVDKDILVAKIGFYYPNGRHSTRTRRGETNSIEDVLIARNALAATMFKAGLIDFDQYLKITQN